MLLFPLAMAAATLPDRPLGPAGEEWYVLDKAEVLSKFTELTLQKELSALIEETSTAIVVVTLPTLDDYPIEMFALELGRTWGVGQEEFNNGVVFLIVPEDHDARIEVGYGLEGVITDANASLILNQIAIPYFKEEDYDNGVLEAVQELDQLARGESFDLEELNSEEDSDLGFPVPLLFLFLWPLFWSILSFLSGTRHWWVGGVWGAIFGFFIGGWGSIVVVGSAGLLLDFIVSKYFFGKIKAPKIRASYLGGGRGGSRGGRSGFGGGSFGGGGASGHW